MPFGSLDLIWMMAIFGGVGWTANRRWGWIVGALFGVIVFMKIRSQSVV